MNGTFAMKPRQINRDGGWKQEAVSARQDLPDWISPGVKTACSVFKLAPPPSIISSFQLRLRPFCFRIEMYAEITGR